MAAPPSLDVSYDSLLKEVGSASSSSSVSNVKGTQVSPRTLASEAFRLIQTLQNQDEDPSHLSECLFRILSTVLKPLFKTLKQSSITASGRKNYYPDSDLTTGRFDTSLFDESSKPWRYAAPWSIDLLTWVLSQYHRLPCLAPRLNTLNSHFPLLVPPILSLIDDDNLHNKTRGFHLLTTFTSLLSSCSSDLLLRTGLHSVFLDALRPNFTHLPTLTSEKDSIMLLSHLYPAYRSLILASSSNTKPTIHTPNSSLLPPSKAHKTQTHLAPLTTLLTTHLLPSFPYAHDHPHLTALLLHHLRTLILDLHIYTAPHLPHILPLLRQILTNPFGVAAAAAAAPHTLHAALDCLEAVVGACGVRVRLDYYHDDDDDDEQEEKVGGRGGEGTGWAAEILRACVGCWMVVTDEYEGQARGGKGQEEEEEQRLKRRLREIVQLTEKCAPELKEHYGRLIEADGGLAELLGVKHT
ncbi:MAG: hypothetical protein Q9227_002661 [Pyrenula ochraceoflavens]